MLNTLCTRANSLWTIIFGPLTALFGFFKRILPVKIPINKIYTCVKISSYGNAVKIFRKASAILQKTIPDKIFNHI